MAKQTEERARSLREMEIATRVKEAKRLGHHPVAVEAARNYLSIPMPVISLMSAYESAFDLPVANTHEQEARDKALRAAYKQTIHYLRFGVLPVRMEPKNYAASEVPMQGGAEEAA